MRKALGILLLLASIGGIAYLYVLAGVVEMIKGEVEFEPFAAFGQLSEDYPWRIILLMGSIGAFLYSFRWFMGRKPPAPLRKGGEGDERARRRHEIAVATYEAGVKRVPGALMMNGYLMISTAAVLLVGARAGVEASVLGVAAVVLGAQLLVGLILALFGLVWERSLFRFGGLVGMVVHVLMAACIGFAVIRGWESLS